MTKTRKILIIVAGIYFSFGFVIAMHSYVGSLKTFDCIDPSTPHGVGMGGFFTNPNPELCTRRGFTLSSIVSIPLLTVLGVPLATAKYYYAKNQ